MKTRNAKTAAFTVGGIVLTALLIIGGIFMFGKSGATISSCESLTLRLSGMRLTEEYEITCDGDTAHISHYYFTYADGSEQRELQNSTDCPSEELVDILNECGFAKWNGFSGKHPKYVTDGTMFSLKATVNGGTEIRADGSENFPKNFHTFTYWLQEKLA